MSRFKDKVIQVVLSVPKGKVVSYGQVALYVGVPRAARQVGWVLNRLEENPSVSSGQVSSTSSGRVPWWRVVNNQGRISIKGSEYSAVDQMNLLRKEGVDVSDDFTFDIEKYRFIPSQSLLKKFELDPFYVSTISKKIPYSNFFPK